MFLSSSVQKLGRHCPIVVYFNNYLDFQTEIIKIKTLPFINLKMQWLHPMLLNSVTLNWSLYCNHMFTILYWSFNSEQPLLKPPCLLISLNISVAPLATCSYIKNTHTLVITNTQTITHQSYKPDVNTISPYTHFLFLE